MNQDCVEVLRCRCEIASAYPVYLKGLWRIVLAVFNVMHRRSVDDYLRMQIFYLSRYGIDIRDFDVGMAKWIDLISLLTKGVDHIVPQLPVSANYRYSHFSYSLALVGVTAGGCITPSQVIIRRRL